MALLGRCQYISIFSIFVNRRIPSIRSRYRKAKNAIVTAMKLLTWLSRRRFPYEPLITVEISRSRLLHNLNEFKKVAPGGTIAPVLKSNAYGHGLFEVASILEHEAGIPFFIVDSYFEAVASRAKHIKTPILIIGYTRPETIKESRLKSVAFTVTNLETLEQIKNVARPIHVHLKIDTGMHRQGILPEEVDAAIQLIKEDSNLILEGICTHLNDADNSDTSYTRNQIDSWNGLIPKFRTAFPSLKYVHASATDGHRFTEKIDANISRLGIGLYGLSENQEILKSIDLQPVMAVKTIVTGIKSLKRGESVGYGNTFTANRDMTIATIPFGYFEGLDRRLSNRGAVEVGEKRTLCPIIGRVSMNITTIDVSTVSNVKIGDEVVTIGNDPTKPNSFAQMAKLCDTITYEGAVKIPGQLKRVVVD